MISRLEERAVQLGSGHCSSATLTYTQCSDCSSHKMIGEGGGASSCDLSCDLKHARSMVAT